MKTPVYYYTIANRHGISAWQWQPESIERLRSIAQAAGGNLTQFAEIAVSTRAQLERITEAVSEFGCVVSDYPEHDDGTIYADIEEFDSYGSHGWCWTIRRQEYNFETGAWNTRRNTYRTGKDGDGLWLDMPNGDWRQLSGTCQYSLPSSEKAARRIVERSLR